MVVLVSIYGDTRGSLLSYMLSYKRYVKRLEDGVNRLCDMRATLRQQVDGAKTEKKTISPEIESWLADVDAIEEPTKRFISAAKRGKRLYDPMARYRLGRKSAEMLRQLIDRRLEGSRFHEVAASAPPPRIGSTFVRILNPQFSRADVPDPPIWRRIRT